MRLTLRLVLVLVTLVCVLFARYSYIANQYNEFAGTDGKLYFDWQQPEISTIYATRLYNEPDGKAYAARAQFNKFDLKIDNRNWSDKIWNMLISKDPVALSIRPEGLSADTIEVIASMQELETILLIDYNHDAPEPHHVKMLRDKAARLEYR